VSHRVQINLAVERPCGRQGIGFLRFGGLGKVVIGVKVERGLVFVVGGFEILRILSSRDILGLFGSDNSFPRWSW